MNRRRLVIISGLSGSGKSTAARALEDEGFFVVDNLPVVLLPDFMELQQPPGIVNNNVAVVVDVRNHEFLSEYKSILQKVQGAGHRVDIYFFDATDDVLMRRYSETRRRHPLMQKEGLSASISRERELLAEVKALATVIIDSSGLTPHQLRAKIGQIARGGAGAGFPLAVLLQSFGYRHGLPVGSDLVMDVRFLTNPHFIPDLRPQTGLSQPVRDYVLSQPDTQEFLKRFLALLKFLLPQYRQEGKSYLTISVGCTGGHHRSVALVEHLRKELQEPFISLEVIHRDIAKG
ncbi:MAG: RNase adapter RapZ [Syntrophotaleaceae bacterium]